MSGMDVVDGIVAAVRERAARERVQVLRMDVSHGWGDGLGDGLVVRVGMRHPSATKDWLLMEVDCRWGVFVSITYVARSYDRVPIGSVLGGAADAERIVGAVGSFLEEWEAGAWVAHQCEGRYLDECVRVSRAGARWGEWGRQFESEKKLHRSTWVRMSWTEDAYRVKGKEFATEWGAMGQAEVDALSRVIPLGIVDEIEMDATTQRVYLELLSRVVRGEMGHPDAGVEFGMNRFDYDCGGHDIGQAWSYFPLSLSFGVRPRGGEMVSAPIQTLHWDERLEGEGVEAWARRKAKEIGGWWEGKRVPDAHG